MLLARLSSCWTATHPRARVAILGLAVTSLKMSDFKLDQDKDGVLADWMDPVLSLVRVVFSELS